MINNEVLRFRLFEQFDNIDCGCIKRDINESDDAYNHKVINFAGNDIFGVKQMHTDQVYCLTQKAVGNDHNIVADAIITDIADIGIYIKTADCCPIMIYAADINQIAVVHAGWRGVYNKITLKTINQLIMLGAKKESIFFGIGPTIALNSYEVDEAFYNNFISLSQVNKQFFSTDPVYRFNIIDAICHQIVQEAGISQANIENCSIDTYTSNEFASFRYLSQHDKAQNYKRFISFIKLLKT